MTLSLLGMSRHPGGGILDHMLILYDIVKCIYFNCSSVLPACMYIMCRHCPWRPEEGVGFPGTEVTDSCELPCGLLGIEPWSCGRAARAISPALVLGLRHHCTAFYLYRDSNLSILLVEFSHVHMDISKYLFWIPVILINVTSIKFY